MLQQSFLLEVGDDWRPLDSFALLATAGWQTASVMALSPSHRAAGSDFTVHRIFKLSLCLLALISTDAIQRMPTKAISGGLLFCLAEGFF